MKSFLILLLSLTFNLIYNEDCSNYDDIYFCEDDYEFSEDWDDNAFQTPARNDIYGRYKSTYQDMHYLMGYAQLKYSQDKKSCTIKVITKVNPILGQKGIDYEIYYTFGENEIMEDSITLNSVDHSFKNGMPISARIKDIKTGNEIVKLELEDEYFLWDNPIVEQPEEYKNGQKGAIVEFFGWPYEDITLECEFLSKAGYLGLKIYSPNEHLLSKQFIQGGVLNPWWYGTQTVSYKLHSRAGDKKDLKKLINTCRSLNVRVYVEVVINHMTGMENDMYEDHISGDSDLGECTHWGFKSGSDGSPFWNIGGRNSNNPITGKTPVVEFPSVPYFPSDFHCYSEIDIWNDVEQLTNGWLSGLADVNTEKDYVQQRIADFFTELISIGISGIAIPNARHIIPESLTAILSKLKSNLGGKFPDDFFAVIIIENIEMSIVMCEEDSGLNYGKHFTNLLREAGFVDDEIYKIKIWLKGWMKGEENFPICNDEWMIDEKRHVISLEFSDDINMGNTYTIYIRDKNIEEHRDKTISMFNNQFNINWEIIFLFSTFSLYQESNGIPDGKSECSFCETENCKSSCTKNCPYRKAYNPISTGYDTGNAENWVQGEYTRIHRDKLIINAMRQWLHKTEMTEEELYSEERLKANCNEKCLICNDESKKKDLCLICNRNENYYPIIYPGTNQEFYECYKYDSSIKYDRLYFDKNENAFKPCYETCKQCEKGGNPENHYCSSCDTNLIQKPNSGSIDTFNCVTSCVNSYYFTSYGQYKCTEYSYCPPEASMLIKEKSKCIDDCQNDDEFKLLYNGYCVKECPEDTIKENNICKNKVISEGYQCTLSTKNIDLDDFYNNNFMDSIVKSYLDEYSYTNKHTLKLINPEYNIFIYKDFDCINIISLQIINVDPNSCIQEIKQQNHIDENLIIVQFETKKTINQGYLIYNPKTGHQLEFENLCTNEVIKTLEIEGKENEYFKYIYLKRIEDDNNDEPTECPEGLYPIVDDNKISYKDCKDKNILYDKYFFNSIEQVFMPCYEFCKTCNKEGNVENNNCLSCESNYIKHPLSTGELFNCVQECKYSYYFTKYGMYKCASTPQCPLDYSKFIIEKNQCIDNCKKDDIYIFLYNGICLKSCPPGTKVDLNDADNLCKEIDFDKCTLSLKEIRLKSFKDDGGLDSLVNNYYDEFFYTNKHISEFNNTYFNIIIYKDKSCLNELNLKYPKIDFGGCYNKVKNNIQEDLIIVLLEKFNKNAPPTSSYSLYNPINGKKLDAESICKNEEIVIEKNVQKALEESKVNNYESILYLANQNINVFDKKDAFYTDICYSFESPNGRDITLEDRLKSFYPNISLCDSGCLSKGVNLTTMNAICNCKFNDISNNEFIEEYGEIIGVSDLMEIISTSNLEVFRCIKYIFKKFKTSIGGYIVLFSIALCITFGLLFYLRDLNIIRMYIVNKTKSYLHYLSKISNSQEDKKIDIIKNELSKNKLVIDIKQNSFNKLKNQNRQNTKLLNEDKQIFEQGKDIFSINRISNSKEILNNSFKENSSKNKLIIINENKEKINEKEKEKEKDIKTEESKDKEKKEIECFDEKENFKKYLESEIDDQEFEDIILEDKRSFQEYFCDTLAEKQIFINTFFSYDPFRPLSIKIILLLLNLIMYIVVNGLFYGEEAVSQIYHIEGDDPFFGFFPRSITRFLYTAVVGVIIGFIIDCFFIEEKKMKKIFIREKENIVNLKYEITKLNKKIKNTYIGFIIFVIILLLFFWIYLLCFNYTYPKTQCEWIKSSITLIIIIQFLSTIIALAETALRFLSFMFRNERLFRVSKLLD